MKTNTKLFQLIILISFLSITPFVNGQNVGIGTSSPGGKLTVVPASNARGVEILSPTAGNTHLPWSNNWNYLSGDGVIFRSATHSEKARIDLNSGNMGIGTTNPTAKLSIIPASGGKGVEVLSPSAGNTYLPYSNNWHYLSGDGVIFRNASGSEKARIDLTSGNVGVGVTSPSHKITISSPSDDVIRLIGPDSYGSGARLNFGDADHVYLDEDADDHLTIYGGSRIALMGGNVGVGTSSPSHRMTVSSTSNDNALRLIGPDFAGSGARLNFGDGDNVYLDEDSNNDLTIYAYDRTAIMGGYVGVGTSSPSHRMTVNNSGSDNVLRLIGPGSSGSGSRLNFGDGDYVYLDEDADDNLHIYADGRLRIHGGYEFEFYHYGNKAAWFDDGNSNLYVKNTTSTKYTWFTSVGSEPAILPQDKNWGYIGSSSRFWYKMYGSDLYTDAGWPLGWVLLDTYDDLELLNSIQADTVWDERLQHHVMVMKPESFPKAITHQDTLEDGSLSDIFVSYKRLTGLLIGSARQLDQQTKERDRRLAARTERIAQAVGMNFSETGTITHKISDSGKQTTNDTEVTVSFSESFKAQLTDGQEAIVQITPCSWYDKFIVASVDENGFTLKVKLDPEESEFSFYWQANADVSIPIEAGIENIDDIFYKKPIEINGTYPSIDFDAPKEELAKSLNKINKVEKQPRVKQKEGESNADQKPELGITEDNWTAPTFKKVPETSTGKPLKSINN
jgi:hypothetical protein